MVIQIQKKALLEKKRANYAAKRKVKQQMKIQESLKWAKADEEIRKQIVKEVWHPDRVEYEVEKRQFKDMYLCAESK